MGIDMNSCWLEGRLGANPEARVLGSGQKVVSARIAVSDDYKDRRTQDWVKRSYWISITAWSHTGDQLENFKKGERIIVHGKWTVDEAEKNGQKQYYNKLTIDLVRGSDMRRGSGSTSGGGQGGGSTQAAPRQSSGGGADFDDDIPF